MVKCKESTKQLISTKANSISIAAAYRLSIRGSKPRNGTRTASKGEGTELCGWLGKNHSNGDGIREQFVWKHC